MSYHNRLYARNNCSIHLHRRLMYFHTVAMDLCPLELRLSLQLRHHRNLRELGLRNNRTHLEFPPSRLIHHHQNLNSRRHNS